ncbi:MAG TPA: M56 family metallopeptidase [Vicinamibacterales bacterium]|nr:M56 family metallopeptidase [Vicinamibacterales bacterium]
MQNEPFALLVLATVRVTVVLSAVWIITLAMRRAAASSRHFVWTAGIVAAALIPAAAIAMPKWQVQAPAAIAALAPAVRPSFTPAASVPAPPAAERSDIVAAPLAPAANRSSRLLSVSSLAMVTWIVGAGAVLLYLFAGTLAAMWIRRSSRALDARWAEEAEALAEAMGIRPPAMFATASVPSPMVAGFWRPCILLPTDAASWPDDRLHVVLLHELAHIKRRDCLTQAIAQIVCGIYWFNPIVWIGARRLRVERERACDDFVLAKGTRGSEYANHLLEIAQTARPERLAPLTLAGVAMARRSQLEGRLMAILDPAIRRSSTTAARLAAAAALVTISVPVAAVQLKDAVPVSAVSTGPIRAAVESIAVPVAAPAAAPAAAAPSQAPGTINAQRPAASAAQPARDPIVGVALARMLVEAVQRGNREEIAALLTAGANVNTPVPGDGSALIAAAQHGHLDIVQSLLARGADIDLGVPGDGTPLIAAAQRGHLEIARLLLDRGADVHKPFTGDGNPLIAASSRGQVRIVQLLLERGARVEDVVDGDENALISASAQGHLDVVQLLVSQGASVNSRVWVEQTFSRQGGPGPGEWRTPLSMARRGGHAAVVTYLQSRGAVE